MLPGPVGLEVEVDFFRLWRRVASWLWAPERNREHSIRIQVGTLNLGFMDHLRCFRVKIEPISAGSDGQATICERQFLAVATLHERPLTANCCVSQ